MECWKAQGVTKAIPGIGYREPAIQQIRACAAGGIAVDCYRYLFGSRDVRDQVNFALETLGDSGVSIGCLWLDCEWDTSGLRPYEVVDRIQQAVDAASTFHSIGIYTRRLWWEAATDNTEQFKDLLLWDSTSLEFVPYGGWTEPAMTQYKLDTNLCGFAVDLSRYQIWGS